MRKVILAAISILAMVIMVSINTASAEKRHIVIEMGESGQTVEFPMSPEEIAAEDAENARLEASRQARLKMPQNQVVSFESTESGMVIEFPVDPPEVYAENRQREISFD